jgi:hypothetical protein
MLSKSAPSGTTTTFSVDRPRKFQKGNNKHDKSVFESVQIGLRQSFLRYLAVSMSMALKVIFDSTFISQPISGGDALS